MLIDLPRFLAHEAHKYMFYGYIRAFRLNFPGVSMEGAINNFMKHHVSHNKVLDKYSFNAESARVTYYNMENQFIDWYKSME